MILIPTNRLPNTSEQTENIEKYQKIAEKNRQKSIRRYFKNMPSKKSPKYPENTPKIPSNPPSKPKNQAQKSPKIYSPLF